MIADFPEPARRYLSYSIAPGTPVRTTVELDMRGQFALGDKESHRVMPMRARQLLSPPSGFVWIPDIGSGVMRIWGSDALVTVEAWTRFWILGLIPVARQAGTADVARSAATRSIMEAIWAFFFIVRDIYATVAFHNFLGMFGVVQALAATGQLSAFTILQPPLLIMAAATIGVLCLYDRTLLRGSQPRS